MVIYYRIKINKIRLIDHSLIKLPYASNKNRIVLVNVMVISIYVLHKNVNLDFELDIHINHLG